MLVNYHIGRLVLSSLCVGAFGAAGFWWCSFCSWSFIRQRLIIFRKTHVLDFIQPLKCEKYIPLQYL